MKTPGFISGILLLLLLSSCSILGTADSRKIPKEGLQAYYPFNGNAQDESGNENHGEVLGASLTKDRFGKENRAYSFDGVDDFIWVDHSASLDLGAFNADFSVSLWVNAVNPSISRILEKWNEIREEPHPFSIRAEPTNFNNAIFDGKNKDIIYVDNPWDGQWRHMVFIANAATGNFHIYQDGKLASTLPMTLTGPTKNLTPMYLGGGPKVNRYFRGQVDDITIYDRALTSKDILDLYHYRNWDE